MFFLLAETMIIADQITTTCNNLMMYDNRGLFGFVIRIGPVAFCAGNIL